MGNVEDIRQRVADAFAAGTPLRIHGGNTKRFLGHPVEADALDITNHSGIIEYTPSELVVTARAGTPLEVLKSALAAENQALAFEPPGFGEHATLGGTIACGLSGPARPYTGAARDFVLGINCINGKGEYLRFGGQVMKNVAGYDISRTLAGSHGTLAVILDISLKILPMPECRRTLVQACSEREAIDRFNRWAGRPLPVSAGCYLDDRLYVRLSGTGYGVQAAADAIGGDSLEDADAFWNDLAEQRLDFFAGERPLWRLSLPPATAPLDTRDDTLIDWGGAQRWLRSDRPAAEIRAMASAAGGHASCFRHCSEDTPRFHPLAPAVLALHKRLKQAFDPAGILNPGRMYPGL